MEELLRLFEGKALATALRNHGHQVSDKTVQRWKAGITHPKSQDMAAVRQLIAELAGHEEAAPPEWAERLADATARKVIEALAPAFRQAAVAELLTRLEGILPPNGGAPHVADEGSDQAGLGQPRRSRE